MSARKELLLDAINYTSEFDELLGKGRGVTRSCFNKVAHNKGDKTPALSFSSKTGAWKCHVCGELGDIFTLYQKVRGLSFPETLELLLRKYGLWEKAGRQTKAVYESSTMLNPDAKFRHLILNTKDKGMLVGSWANWAVYDDRRQFMFDRYGLKMETLRYWGVGYDAQPGSGRVFFPVWETDGPNGKLSSQPPRMVNIRKHDCFRIACQWASPDGIVQRARPPHVTMETLASQELQGWTPKWSNKVLSVAGHGAAYLYPMQVMFEATSLYLVGGEPKALLLNQEGVPAVTFTGGEGGYTEELLPMFIGKRVRLLMDVDAAGVYATFGRPPGIPDKNGKPMPAIIGLGQRLANAGAYVEGAIWPEEIKSLLPPKGDVTDLLLRTRAADGSFRVEVLDMLEWVVIERQEVADMADLKGIEVTAPEMIDWNELTQVEFGALVEPANVKEWVKFSGMVSGRGESPFIVPKQINASCERGRLNPRKLCEDCKLARTSHKAEVNYSTEAQLDLVASSKLDLMLGYRRTLGIPKSCDWAELDIVSSAAEQVVLSPVVSGVDGGVFEYRTGYILAEQAIKVRENVSYDFGGQILADPKHGRFLVAIRESRAMDGNILNFVADAPLEEELKRLLDGAPGEVTSYLITQMREHITQIYAQDDMLLVILLSMFMPFKFSVGTKENERICPAVLVLGDSTVGKSTAAKRMIRHYRAGKFNSMAEHPTFAGLVGGNVQMGGGRQAFSWGVLPRSNKTWLVLDEANKMTLDLIGSMTNVMSSGQAQRSTNAGDRKIDCEVRLLYLANPRGERQLRSFSNPIEAAQKIMGTVQDLGRIDLLLIQQKLKDKSVFDRLPEPTTPLTYHSDVARHHLSWVWSLTPDRIRFVDPQYVLERANVLSLKFGDHPLLYAAQAWGKVGRIAAGFAAMVYSTDGWNLVVRRAHVDLAVGLLERLYGPLLGGRGAGLLPDEFVRILDHISIQRLRSLISLDRFSRGDLEDFVGRMEAMDILAVGHAQYGLFTKVGLFFRWSDEHHADALADYLGHRVAKERNGV